MEDRLAALVIPLSARIIDAAQAIRENKNRCVVAVADGKVVGVLSEGDIMKALLHGSDVHGPIADWVSHGFKFLREHDRRAAFDLMRKHGITLVPVVDEEFRLTDVVTLFEVLAHCDLRDEAPGA
ncbi:hypothetical protein C882_3343 [Caenispirillum salinarum AK4]|uniref:CBS domain-containing protein n=1 Tax=Caenispirillum salinarum AK4 TaxID=1238182 RepID=K9HBC2_9PROT|nr:CBS domain-containing protein [Caenispirillum salinarum]EKV26056.1 hypothetical protein C882_3343 [Caenispirillum salinarum AK4]